MTEDQLVTTMLASSFMKADLLRRIRLVREFSEQRFFTPSGKKELPEFYTFANVSEEDQKVLNGWGKDFFSSFTKENAYDLLEKIAAKTKDLPAINLYVPINPDANEAGKLGAWFRANVDKFILIEVHVDSSTFGGCAFAWNGVYYDYSLRHYMHRKMDGIRKVLDEFTKEKE